MILWIYCQQDTDNTNSTYMFRESGYKSFTGNPDYWSDTNDLDGFIYVGY